MDGTPVRDLMIKVDKKYVLGIRSSTPITSERQDEEYLSVLDKLASKEVRQQKRKSIRRSW